MEKKSIQDLEKEINEFISVNELYFKDDGSPFHDGLNQSDFKYYYIYHEDCELRKIIAKCEEEGKNYKKAFRQWISSSSVISKLLDAIIGNRSLIMISAGNPHLGYLNQNWTYIYLLMSAYGIKAGFYTCKFSIPSQQEFIINNYHTKYNFSYFVEWFNEETKNNISEEKLEDILNKTPLFDNHIMRLSKTELIDSINGYIAWNISICPHLKMQCKMNGSPDCPKCPASSADCPIRKTLYEYKIKSCRKYYVDISVYDVAKLCASKNEMISYIKERHEKNTAKVIEEEKRWEKEKEEKERKAKFEEMRKRGITTKYLYTNLKNREEIEHIRTPEGKEEQRLKFKDFREEILRKNEGTAWAAHYPCIGGYSNPYKKEDGRFSIILSFSAYSTLKEIKEYLRSCDLRELAIYALDSCTGYHLRSQEREISDEEKHIRELINTAPIKGVCIDCWNRAMIYFLTEDPEVTKKKRVRRLKEKKRRNRKKREEEEKQLEAKADRYARKAKPSDEVVLVKDLDELYKQIIVDESSYEIEGMD